MFKKEKEFKFQDIYNSNIPHFLSFPWIFEFKVILKLFPEQIQNSGIFRTQDVLTLFRMGFFGAAHGYGVAKNDPHPSLKSATHILQ